MGRSEASQDGPSNVQLRAAKARQGRFNFQPIGRRAASSWRPLGSLVRFAPGVVEPG